MSEEISNNSSPPGLGETPTLVALLDRFTHSFPPSKFVRLRYSTEKTPKDKSKLGWWKKNNYCVWTVLRTCGDVCHLRVIQMGRYVPESVAEVWEVALPYWRVTHNYLPEPGVFIFYSIYLFSNFNCSH
jgi:hypothetical protein